MCRKQKVCVGVPVSQSIGPHLHASLSLSLSLSAFIRAALSPCPAPSLPVSAAAAALSLSAHWGGNVLILRSSPGAHHHLHHHLHHRHRIPPLVFSGLFPPGLIRSIALKSFVDYCSLLIDGKVGL